MHYHLVGIAGAGISAIANMLLDQGHTVSGSDKATNVATAALMQRGAVVHTGHDAAWVQGADRVIATSAVPGNHVELVAAQQQGIPLLRRVDVYREWSRQRSIIAIAGTHGKTTTTAMLSFIFLQAGIDAGFLIGADFPQMGISARWGDPSAPLIVEADEYDRTFLGLSPAIAVVTCIEWDHPDIYATEADYDQAFASFLTQVQDVIVVSEQVARGKSHILPLVPAPSVPDRLGTDLSKPDLEAVRLLTYGMAEENNYYAVPLDEPPGTWSIEHRYSACSLLMVQLTLAVPGIHNVQNALAALCVADVMGLDVGAAAQDLAQFRGVARRFEVKGEAAGIVVIDDYAHHPSEVVATLAAARERYETRRIVAYLQPHTFSRTQALMDQWPAALLEADVVWVGDVYAAREHCDDFWKGSANAELQAATAEEWFARTLVQRVAMVHTQVGYAGGIEEAVKMIRGMLKSGDILVTLGAGDGFCVGEHILHLLHSATEERNS
jgi:UDP-N-acetylmuramate--alanine ligase